MHLELAQLQHFVITPEKEVGSDNIELPPDRAPEEAPWRRPLDLRLRASLRLGVLLSFLVAGLLLTCIRAASVTQEATANIRAEARALAASASLSLAQNDRNAALALLEGLSERKHVTGVALYDLHGRRFADYAVSNAALLQLPAPGREQLFHPDFWSERFPGGIVVWEPVKTRFENVGWLVLEADLGARWQAYFSELSWMGAALLASLLLCTNVVARVQRHLTEPMFRLAKTSKVIVEDRDYTLRAWKDGRDEIGSVTDAFNHLLDEIQRRGSSLVELRGELASVKIALEKMPTAAPVTDAENQRRQTQFLVNMCHEIRTPMNRATAIAKRLAASGLPDHQLEMLSSIRGIGELVLGLTDDLLDYTRIEAGKLELHHAEFNPTEIGETVVRMYQDRASSKKMLLRANVPVPLPLRVRGDSARIRQIIGCLVSNSIKYCQEGEVCIEITATVRTDERMDLCFEVRDAGFGIAEVARGRIFETLSRSETGPGAPSGSAGLGLIIAHHLVERMGGALQLIEDTGTKRVAQTGFRFALPLEVLEGAPLASAGPRDQHETAGVEQPGTVERNALIFDDAPANRKGLRQILQKLSYRVETAATLDEVRQCCERHSFEVIFASIKCLSVREEAMQDLKQVVSMSSSRPAHFVVTYQRDREAALVPKEFTGLAFPFRRKEVDNAISGPARTATPAQAVSPSKSAAPVRADLSASVLNQVMEVYLDSAPDLIEQLKSALMRSDVTLTQSTARTLGTCSSKLGAMQLANLCERIEAVAALSEPFEGPSYIAELDQTFSSTRALLRMEVSGFDSAAAVPSDTRSVLPAMN